MQILQQKFRLYNNNKNAAICKSWSFLCYNSARGAQRLSDLTEHNLESKRILFKTPKSNIAPKKKNRATPGVWTPPCELDQTGFILCCTGAAS